MRWNPLQVDLRSKKEFLRRKRQKSGISFYVICDDVLSFWPWQEKEIIRRSYRVPFVTLYPQSYSIHLNNLDPQSVVFVDIIDYFKDYFPSIYEWDVQIYFAAGHQTTSRRDMHYRSVRYWLDQQRGDVPEFPKYFYHGTCSELWYEGVASEGLKPRLLGHGGSSGSFGAGGALSMEDRVYISIHPDNAAREAAFQAAQKHGGLPLILRIKSDLLDPTNLVPDEDAHAEDVIQNAYEVFGCNPRGRCLFLSERWELVPM